MVYIYNYSVFNKINIKGGGVHQWYMMFGQQCCKTIFSVINFILRARLKGGGAEHPGYHPLG